MSYFGFIDYIYSPEGGKVVGCYHGLTIYSYVTIPKNPDKILNFLNNHKNFLKFAEKNNKK